MSLPLRRQHLQLRLRHSEDVVPDIAITAEEPARFASAEEPDLTFGESVEPEIASEPPAAQEENRSRQARRRPSRPAPTADLAPGFVLGRAGQLELERVRGRGEQAAAQNTAVPKGPLRRAAFRRAAPTGAEQVEGRRRAVDQGAVVMIVVGVGAIGHNGNRRVRRRQVPPQHERRRRQFPRAMILDWGSSPVPGRRRRQTAGGSRRPNHFPERHCRRLVRVRSRLPDPLRRAAKDGRGSAAASARAKTVARKAARGTSRASVVVVAVVVAEDAARKGSRVSHPLPGPTCRERIGMIPPDRRLTFRKTKANRLSKRREGNRPGMSLRTVRLANTAAGGKAARMKVDSVGPVRTAMPSGSTRTTVRSRWRSSRPEAGPANRSRNPAPRPSMTNRERSRLSAMRMSRPGKKPFRISCTPIRCRLNRAQRRFEPAARSPSRRSAPADAPRRTSQTPAVVRNSDSDGEFRCETPAGLGDCLSLRRDSKYEFPPPRGGREK